MLVDMAHWFATRYRATHYESPTMAMKAPRCAACDRALPIYEPEARRGVPNPMRGRCGDGVVCGHLCGYRLAMRLIEQVPGVLALLTPSLPDPRPHTRLPVPTPSGGTVTVIGNSFANDSPRARRRQAEELVSQQFEQPTEPPKA